MTRGAGCQSHAAPPARAPACPPPCSAPGSPASYQPPPRESAGHPIIASGCLQTNASSHRSFSQSHELQLARPSSWRLPLQYSPSSLVNAISSRTPLHAVRAFGCKLQAKATNMTPKVDIQKDAPTSCKSHTRVKSHWSGISKLAAGRARFQSFWGGDPQVPQFTDLGWPSRMWVLLSWSEVTFTVLQSRDGMAHPTRPPLPLLVGSLSRSRHRNKHTSLTLWIA